MIHIPEALEGAQKYFGAGEEELRTFLRPDKSQYTPTVRQKAASPVKFSCANILEDLENIDDKNPSLVMCRNMWPYIDVDEYDDYAEKLYERLAPGSVVVVGLIDYTTGTGFADFASDDLFPNCLKNAGFTPLTDEKINLIFLKD